MNLMSYCLYIENIGRLYTPVTEWDKTTVKMVEDAVIFIRDGKIVEMGSRKSESRKVGKSESQDPTKVGGEGLDSCLRRNDTEEGRGEVGGDRQVGTPDGTIKGTTDGTTVVDAKGMVALPGFVDAHTHPAFATTREDEFFLRNQGKSYQEIAAMGGGIHASVRKLRELPQDELTRRIRKRYDRFLEYGTVMIEAKSGYGLNWEAERKQLVAIHDAAEGHPLTVVPTFLGAHEIPAEYKNNREEYIRLLTEEMIPQVAKENLAEGCDVFCEQGVYTVEEAERILHVAKKYGLQVHIHADQLSDTGGAVLAAKLGARSAEHLDFISSIGIDAMIEAGVIFNLLPGAVFFLGLDKYPPAREIIDRGGTVALSTDFNPGSSMTQSLPMMMTLGAIHMGMTAEELLCAVTINAAAVLGREDQVGSLEVGKIGHVGLWDIPNLESLPYCYGMNMLDTLVVGGEEVRK
jgi:imidazolonepropionase